MWYLGSMYKKKKFKPDYNKQPATVSKIHMNSLF